MKMNKKKVFVTALAVCMIAILSFSTLAWFSDQESVTNRFQVATSDDDSAGDIFSVDVYEWVEDDDDDNIDESEKIEEGGYTFEDVMPGDKLKKQPVVENTGRYDQWVRLTIKFSSIDAWYALQDGDTANGPITLLSKSEDWDRWIFAGLDYTTEDAYVYTYYLNAPLTPGEKVGTFTFVNIPTSLDQNDLFDIQSLELEVLAEAVQVENVGAATAEEAFAIVNP